MSRILIRNRNTGLYLCKGDQWSGDPSSALAFLNEIRASDHCVYRRLSHASVVILPESQPEPWVGQAGTGPLPTTNQRIEIEEMKAKNSQSGKAAKTKTPDVRMDKAPSKPMKAAPPAAQPAVVKPAPVEALKAAPPVTTKEVPPTKPPAEEASCGATMVTTIEARVDVGLGNHVFIRGEGNGLSWAKGEPLRCVDGSTWIWSTTCSLEKVVFKLVLNDQVWAQGDNVIAPAGTRTQVAPAF